MPTSAERLSSAAIANAMRRAGWPASAIPIGVAVAMAESGGNPRALNTQNRNGSTDYGLFQINSIHRSILASGTWYDPVDNARMALTVYRDAGNKWTPWVTYKSGSYRKFYRASPGGDPTLAAVDPGNGGGDDDDFGDGLRNGITDTFGGAGQVAAFSLGFVGSEAFWQRFGIGLLGVALIIIGVWIIFRQPLGDATKNLINLAPQGRALNIAKGLVKK